jgi:DNA-binding transcriptional regulator/RsmH inhibitor MraZ
MLPPPLIRSAQLRKEVTVVGNYGSIEVWDRKAWQEYERNLDENAAETARRLARQRTQS